MIRNRLALAVNAGHFAVDAMNSTVPVMLATLAITLGLSNGQIGTALTVQVFAGALSQPLFGWLADRFRGRPSVLAGAGVAWMALCLAGAAVAPGWGWIVPLVGLMALGSGLFHPIGTASAAAANPARAASATAMFFFSGQVGLSVGPVLGGALLGTAMGSTSVVLLCALALLPALLLLAAPRPPIPVAGVAQAGRAALRAAPAIVLAFVALVAVRSSIQQVFMAFLPKLFADRGWEPAAYGAIAGTFMFTAAVGNIVAGDIADRFGMRAATLWPLLLSVPAGLACVWAPTPAAAFAGAALAGILVGGQHSVLVVHAQRLLPVRQGFAAGLILGFTFASGGIGTWLGGLAADATGLPLMMQAATLLALPAAALALTLPGRQSPTLASEPVQV
ncbi:MAG TPA: MFS transporter [Roseiflexaceae bacterium]|nr:MFS transporter [Roseiflexaceae bacterium]